MGAEIWLKGLILKQILVRKQTFLRNKAQFFPFPADLSLSSLSFGRSISRQESFVSRQKVIRTTVYRATIKDCEQDC